MDQLSSRALKQQERAQRRLQQRNTTLRGGSIPYDEDDDEDEDEEDEEQERLHRVSIY